ncbi:MAG: class I SAM-dependent RNA methyltransferase, partial [Deltaproteobacteria bacterium]
KLGPKGDGIAQGTRGPIFVERSVPLDKLNLRIFKDKEGITRGQILKIISPSPYRQDPPCPHFDSCGNCTLQHLSQDFYKHWKAEVVKEAFSKNGLRPQKWLPPIFLGGHNRRRVTFTALKHRGKIKVGYYQRRSKEIFDLKSCEVIHPKLLELKNQLISLFPLILQDGKPIDIFVQWVNGSIDMVLSGPLGKSGKPEAKLVSVLKDFLETSPVARVSWRTDEKTEVLFRSSAFEASFGRLTVSLPPAAFLQPTEEGEAALVKAVMNGLPSKGKFADLFSGCGTFSGPMLDRGTVDAFESLAPAVKSLSNAIGKNPLKVFRRDLFKNPVRHQDLNRFDAIVFDPP